MLAAVLVMGAVAAVHWPVLSAQALCLDDDEFFNENPLVQNPGWESTKRFFAEVLEPSTVGGYYLPLSMVSLMADYAMGGRPGNLRVFHRTSLILHVANSVLVFIILYALFGDVLAAALCALVFGLHPLTVEPVAWIGERKTLLAAFFSFLAILSYVRFARRGGWSWMAASVTAYFLALLSKPTAVPLPLLLLALDYWPLRRWSWRAIIKKWPYFALAVGFTVITVISHERTAGIAEAQAADLMRAPLRVCHLLAFYLGKIAWPANLSSVYSAPDPMAASNPAIIVGVLVTIAVAVGVAFSIKRTRAVLAGAAFFLFGLAPTLGVVQYSWVYASDKYVYIPILGILMLVAVLLVHGWRRSPAVRVVIVVSSVGLFVAEAWATRAYLTEWRDTRSLSEHILAIAPENPQIRVNLAGAYADEGRREDAIEQYREAIRIKPDYALAHSNLGGLLAKEGDTTEAIRQFQEAVQIDPDFAVGHNNLAVLYLKSGDLDLAEHHCEEALRLKPGYPRPLFNLANVRAAQGRSAEAIGLYRKATAVDADYVEAYRNLGRLLLSQGSAADAADSYRQALRIDVDSAATHFGLAMSLLQMHRKVAALKSFERAMQLAPDWAAPINGAAWILATDDAQRDSDRALELAKEAARLTDYRDSRVLDTLAAAYAAGGDFRHAISTIQDAIRMTESSGAESEIDEMRARLEEYESGHRHTEKP